jgi:hypothetical protein
MITGDGESASTLQKQEAAKKCFNAYAAINKMQPLMSTTRDVFCDVKFFQKFALYLTNANKMNKNTLSDAFWLLVRTIYSKVALSY